MRHKLRGFLRGKSKHFLIFPAKKAILNRETLRGKREQCAALDDAHLTLLAEIAVVIESSYPEV